MGKSLVCPCPGLAPILGAASAMPSGCRPTGMAGQSVVGNRYHGVLRVRENPSIRLCSRINATVKRGDMNQLKIWKRIYM